MATSKFITTVKRLFNKKETYEEKLDRYKVLHDQTLKVNHSGTNLCLIAHADSCISRGYSVEEAYLHSLMFACAYVTAREWGDSAAMHTLYSSSHHLHSVIKQWADDGLISPERWSHDTVTIATILLPTADAEQMLELVLDDLYRNSDHRPLNLAFDNRKGGE